MVERRDDGLGKMLDEPSRPTHPTYKPHLPFSHSSRLAKAAFAVYGMDYEGQPSAPNPDLSLAGSKEGSGSDDKARSDESNRRNAEDK